MKTFASHALTAAHIAAATLLAMGATNAFAQFTVLDQRGLIVTSASSEIATTSVTTPGSTPQTDSHANSIAPGDVSSQNLTAQASVSNDFSVAAQASLRTIATSSVVGLADDISLSFQQQVATLSPDLWVSGSVAVISALTFSVDAPTDVSISISRPDSPIFSTPTLYSNWTLFAVDKGPISGSLSTSPLSSDALTPVQSDGGLAHLDAGNYVIELNSQYGPPVAGKVTPIVLAPGSIKPTSDVFQTPTSLPLSSASIMITAVPEPGTWSLSLLGLVGLAAAYRRRRTTA